MRDNLLSDAALIHSDVVANNRMNRERQAIGVNSYQKDLGFDLITFLEKKIREEETVRWLDIGCGRGKALIQIANYFKDEDRIQFEGVDLVNMFDQHNEKNLLLRCLDLHQWVPEVEYDLITAVHSIHYIGDKLKLIRDVVSSLKKDGLFIAHIDLKNIQVENKKKQFVYEWFLSHNFLFSNNRHILKCFSTNYFEFQWQYLGSDDRCGPNYTGQEAVNSYYQWIE